MDSKEVVLVTGANTRAQQAVKSAEKECPASSSTISPVQIDMEDDDSIYRALEEIKTKIGKLDVLLNNTGAQLDQQLASDRMTMRQMWNQSWNVNTTGTQMMTTVFMPLLIQCSNPRLLFITGGTSTLAGTNNLALAVSRPSAKGWPKGNFDGSSVEIPTFHSSKADGVKVWAIYPGYLATSLGGSQEVTKKMGAGDPAVAGAFIRSVVEGARDRDVGNIILKDGIQAW